MVGSEEKKRGVRNGSAGEEKCQELLGIKKWQWRMDEWLWCGVRLGMSSIGKRTVGRRRNVSAAWCKKAMSEYINKRRWHRELENGRESLGWGERN